MEEHGSSLEERGEFGREKQKQKNQMVLRSLKGSQGASRTGVKVPAGKEQGQRGGLPGPAKGQESLVLSL